MENQTVKDYYKKNQIYRISVVILMILISITIIIKRTYFRFLNDQVLFLSGWEVSLSLLYFLLMWQQTNERQNQTVKTYLEEINKDFLNDLLSVLLSGGFCVIVFFWLILFKNKEYKDSFSFFETLYYHGIIYVLVVIEFFTTNFRMNTKQIVLLVFFMFSYTVFNLAYVLITGTTIYKDLTFKDFNSIIFVSSAVTFCLIGYVVFRVLEVFKFGNKYKNKTN